MLLESSSDFFLINLLTKKQHTKKSSFRFFSRVLPVLVASFLFLFAFKNGRFGHSGNKKQ
jgi:hypothetical protein